tara:strand:+ start:87015 stop:89405 length:2391 start_codon:yes stop_codon:yes gene_type:complete
LNSADLAFDETLELLEWPTLCRQLATFSTTVQGEKHCIEFALPPDLKTSQRYLSETLEISALDKSIDGGLSLDGINDIGDILLRCSKGGIVSGEELLKVAETLRSARRLRRQIDDPETRPIISSLMKNMATFPELERLIEFGVEEGGRVADRASEKLSGLRYKWHNLRMERRERLQDLLRRYSSILQDTVVLERFNRPVIALKIGTADQVPGTVHDSSSSGNTVFLEPASIIPIGNRIAELAGAIFEEEQILLAQWSAQVGERFSKLEHLCHVMLQLDLALARARYGDWLKGVPPLIGKEQDAPFLIEKFRHPLLIWQECFNDGEVVVPISFEVSSELRVVAITGPNTGGKTVALKSLGLAILMTRSGLLLPCIGTPSLPWCNQVLADIGDEQSLQQNLSTFSGHIVRICRIFRAIELRPGPSIVLLDEIGAGTDPTEGTALAIALLRFLAEKVRLTIATTHFGELKALKYSDSRFENASVAFDSETIRPKYQLQWGIPGKSNALAIANRLGLDSAITEDAQKLIGNKDIEDVNQVIKGLENERQRQQEAAEDAAALLVRTELLHEELLERWQLQRKKTQEFQERSRYKLEISIRRGQEEVRNLIRRLRDVDANGEVARTTGKRLRQIQNDYQKETIKRTSQDWSPSLGDRVRLISLGKAGEVIDISDDGLQLTVLCGFFRSTVELSDVESLDGLKPTVPEPVVNLKTSTKLVGGATVRTKRNTLDVRGLRVHEAIAVVEERLRHSSGPIWVIHGIGTGKLKRGLRDWLASISYIEKVVDAIQADGGAGCSVIWIK